MLGEPVASFATVTTFNVRLLIWAASKTWFAIGSARHKLKPEYWSA